MKLPVDKLPKTKEECLFCVPYDKTFHRCLFSMRAYDINYRCDFKSDSCSLVLGQECPYLKEEKQNETLD